MAYTIQEHQHRLAAWAASRAASVKGCRFKVQKGVTILEAAGFNASFADPSYLPKPRDTDQTHRGWREKIIKAAGKEGLNFTHGVAAKLINCYLKVRFVCAGKHRDRKVKCLHPPIDNELLKELIKQDAGGFGKEWRGFRKRCWSKFDSSDYEDVIRHVRKSLQPGTPLWKIEEYWKGHQ